METRTEDGGLTRRPTLASSWDATGRALTHNLLLTRAGLRARDFYWEELQAPPAPGQDLVILKRSLNNQDENPCFLYLKFGPDGGEEIASIDILSSARNMEVYFGEEYCGTSRGKSVLKHKIIFYKNYLILASSTHACKIKLLSFGERQRVFISKVVIHMRAVSNSSTSSPALKSRIDLDRVQTIMESMGSKLSPGAQHLMNMVRFQQWNCIPIKDQLQSVLANTGYKHMIGLQSSSTLGSSSTPFPFRTGLTSANVMENLQAYIDKSTQASGGENSTKLDECKIVLQNHSLFENDLKNAMSSFLSKKARNNLNLPNSELLPFLQNLYSQVNYLCLGHKAEWQENLTKTDEGNLGEHIDDKIALLMDLLQNPNSSPTGMPLRHYDSGERLSNGER
uniref:Uncharacterized protein n=1 Tax=Aotus nancymaae TaxID=37293 RepID=A0A2K5C1A5_AOTNA